MWAELPDDVREELADTRFLDRTHGIRGTYAKASDGGKGCRGPLCRKAERDDAADKYARRRAREGKTARIGLKDDEARSRDALLSHIQRWHRGERELARLNKLVQSDDNPEPELETAV